MSSYAGRPHNKRQKKETSLSLSLSLSRLSLVPHDVALNCLSRLSRFDRAVLSVTSKSLRSLVVSPDLYRTRELMGFSSDEYWYVCLSIPPYSTPRWFILRRTRGDDDANKSVNRRLRPIPSYPYQPPESSSFVVLGCGIYVIGGIIHGNPTSDVLLLDCLSHSWRRIRSMRVARASAAANVVDGKIYVFGGCKEVESSNWAEVFDPKTQTWDTLPLPEDPEIRRNTSRMDKSVVMEDKVYAVDEDDQTIYYLPREGIWRRGNRDSKRGNRRDWCAVGGLLYCTGTRGSLMWCEPDELDWKKVMGLDVYHWCRFGLNGKLCVENVNTAWKLYWTDFGFSRVTSNSRGNIVVFWKVYLPRIEEKRYPSLHHKFLINGTKRLELWCAEISLKRNPEGEVWGTIEWADLVSKLDPHSYNVKVFFSGFLLVHLLIACIVLLHIVEFP